MHGAILAFNVLQYVGYLMPRASSLERTIVSGKTHGHGSTKPWGTAKGREAWRFVVHGVAESEMT